MCIIIHKPAGASIPAALLAASASLNRDGWGLMGFAPDGEQLVERHAHVSLDALLIAEEKYRAAEIVLHLRLLTRGSTDAQNQHPIAVGDVGLLMHNGTLAGLETAQCGRSDTWHFANNVLRPLLERDAGLPAQPAFRLLIEMALGADNKAVLLHAPSRSITVFNPQLGTEIDGLWCSGTRWIDQRLYHLPDPPQPQTRSLAPGSFRFI